MRVEIRGVPDWVDADRLLGPGDWVRRGAVWCADLDRVEAADIQARLRGVGLDGRRLDVSVYPALKRPLVRDARAADARRRRDTTPGFTRRGVRLDDVSRSYLTPESLALALGDRVTGRHVVDATCGAGGNTIGFARSGCEVLAIDLDAGRLDQARHNAVVYDVAHRITFVHGRAQDVVTGGDVLFVDPPWGLDWDRAGTTVADLTPLAELLHLASAFTTTFVKVPPSFETDTVPGATPEAWFGEAPGDARRVKYVLLRLGA